MLCCANSPDGAADGHAKPTRQQRRAPTPKPSTQRPRMSCVSERAPACSPAPSRKKQPDTSMVRCGGGASGGGRKATASGGGSACGTAPGARSAEETARPMAATQAAACLPHLAPKGPGRVAGRDRDDRAAAARRRGGGGSGIVRAPAAKRALAPACHAWMQASFSSPEEHGGREELQACIVVLAVCRWRGKAGGQECRRRWGGLPACGARCTQAAAAAAACSRPRSASRAHRGLRRRRRPHSFLLSREKTPAERRPWPAAARAGRWAGWAGWRLAQARRHRQQHCRRRARSRTHLHAAHDADVEAKQHAARGADQGHHQHVDRHVACRRQRQRQQQQLGGGHLECSRSGGKATPRQGLPPAGRPAASRGQAAWI